jgi:hypothetical protein
MPEAVAQRYQLSILVIAKCAIFESAANHRGHGGTARRVRAARAVQAVCVKI